MPADQAWHRSAVSSGVLSVGGGDRGEYTFHELGFQKYNIRCLETNEPMIKQATRLDCHEEGRIRRQIYTDGEYHAELIFGLTREEFDELTVRLNP